MQANVLKSMNSIRYYHFDIISVFKADNVNLENKTERDKFKTDILKKEKRLKSKFKNT